MAPLVGAAVAGLVFRGFAHTPGRGVPVSADPGAAREGGFGGDGGDGDGHHDADDGDGAPAAPVAPAAPSAPVAPSDEARDFFDKRTP